ncbi:MAG TPA: TonB-dependent receptor, partial [Flavobacterium sp.]|nr:TonB-dependent receptor [Flavobacterium sp.]
MNKYLFSILVTVLFSVFSFAQETGSVTGKIVASDNSPIDNATVTVNGTKFGGKTNDIGEFEFKNLKAGNYTLKVTHVNFTTKETPFTIAANQKTTISGLQLNTRSETLKEINVTGNSNKYTKRESDYVARMPIKNLENSQVYSVVTNELMKDQLVVNQDEALKNITGLYQIWGSTNRAGDGGSYFASRGFVTQALLRNGIVGRVTSNSDAANLERIESIKGPSATLFGSILTSYGGLINRVTKKPYDGFGGEIAYQGGSYGFNRVTADVNTPVNEDHTALFRFNGSFNNANTFQDFGSNRSYFAAPSFSYQVNEKLNVSIEAEISNVEAAGMPLIYIPYGASPSDLGIFNAKDIPMDFKRSFHGGDFVTTTKSVNIFAQALYKFNDKWSSQSVFSSGSNRANGIQPWFYLLPNYQIERDAWNANGRDNTMEFQQNFNGDFNIGSIRNRVLVGGDVLHNTTNLTYGYLNGGFTTFDTVNYTGTAANYYDFNPTTLAG